MSLLVATVMTKFLEETRSTELKSSRTVTSSSTNTMITTMMTKNLTDSEETAEMSTMISTTLNSTSCTRAVKTMVTTSLNLETVQMPPSKRPGDRVEMTRLLEV